MWRVGAKVPISVYEDDRPVCQCHNEDDAARIVRAMNAVAAPEAERWEYREVREANNWSCRFIERRTPATATTPAGKWTRRGEGGSW